jgi:polyphosphate kinase
MHVEDQHILATDVSFHTDDAALKNEFLNRDLSWLEFNRRVLAQAQDDRTPLLERLRFLGIFTSNLDEFFMKRLGRIRRQIAAKVVTPTPDGKAIPQMFAEIRACVKEMLAIQSDVYVRQIKPALKQSNIHLLEWEELSDIEREAAEKYFDANVFPVLTPLAVDPGSPFPFMSNLSMSLGVVLLHPDREEPLFARVKVPEVLPKWIPVTTAPGQYRFVSLHEMIRHNLKDLFPDMTVVDVMLFRLTRNADIERDEEDADDLRELMQEELKQRRFERVVRLEHGPNPNQWIIQFLMQELSLTENDVYEHAAELDYDDLRPVTDLNIPALRYELWNPVTPKRLAGDEVDVFSAIRTGDLLLHHPYESFNASTERFISVAAADKKVLAIKMTLYRTSDMSPFVGALVRAADSGKQVVCLIELKARFDEERNIHIADMLEKAGVHVLYGIVGLKTHTKTTLVVREEIDGIRCYAHIGTGNYHATTAKLYTDLAVLTCDADITRDVVELFHYLTGRSLKREYRQLLVAPVNMRDRFRAMIQREVDNAKAGKPAHIIAKMNALEDRKICHDLYGASQAGVPIDLIVRGFCTLRPGVPGLSETIKVRSIIGRFLEHSRIYYFRNGTSDPLDGEFYIGSADWMYRNLLARVEAVVPIKGRGQRERLWMILQTMLKDNRQAWSMGGDGKYTRVTAAEGEAEVATHQTFMALAKAESVVERD